MPKKNYRIAVCTNTVKLIKFEWDHLFLTNLKSNIIFISQQNVVFV